MRNAECVTEQAPRRLEELCPAATDYGLRITLALLPPLACRRHEHVVRQLPADLALFARDPDTERPAVRLPGHHLDRRIRVKAQRAHVAQPPGVPARHSSDDRFLAGLQAGERAVKERLDPPVL